MQKAMKNQDNRKYNFHNSKLGFDLFFLRFLHLTISYHKALIKPIPILIKNWLMPSLSKSKNLVNGGTKRSDKVMAIVIPIMIGTRLFLYLKVVKMEYIKERFTKVKAMFALIRAVKTMVRVTASFVPF